MVRARLSAAVVVFGALIALALVVAVPRASAVEVFPVLPTTMLTEHFAIHYDTDPKALPYITQQQATDLGGWVERAYALYVSWGYPAPPAGPSGRIDIDVQNFKGAGPPWDLFDAAAEPCVFAPVDSPKTCGDPQPPPGTGAGVVGTLEFDNKTGLNVHEAAHLVFNLFEFGMWNESQPDIENNYYWLEQSAAEWAAYRVESFLTPTQSSLPVSDSTGDCVGGQCANPNLTAAPNANDRAGDSGWMLMEYLSERYGPDIVKSFFADAAAATTRRSRRRSSSPTS